MKPAPNYLKDYSELWKTNPLAANLEWFKNAKWGLFLHYGLYSQLAKGEWVLFKDKVNLSEYEKLYDTFNPEKFDADLITDLALEAEMSYVNLTACHHEGFCLWKSNIESFNSYNACKRDLVHELAESCDRKGLGFFTYFTHVYNWRHPYCATNDMLLSGRPAYDYEEPRYLLKSEDELTKYWEWSHQCIEELLALDTPLAGMWLDIIMAYYLRPDLVPIEATYKLIREKRPETLISFKQGATGTEDFASPEFHFNSQEQLFLERGQPEAAERAKIAWEKNKSKHNEICMTLQNGGWGYNKNSDHLTADKIREVLAYAIKNNCNLLANTGPLPDGSIHPEDVESLKEVGKRIREYGWPPASDVGTPAGQNPDNAAGAQ